MDTEKRYANIEREMLAVVVACKKFHSSLFGKRFMVESDHKPFEVIHLKNLTPSPPRLQRLLLRVQGYDFTIKYKPGTDMLLADLMSKLNLLPNEKSLEVCLVRFSNPELSSPREIIYSGWPEKQKQFPVPLRKCWTYRDELSIENGVVPKGRRVIIPESERDDIIAIHQAHQGVAKCQLRGAFWPKGRLRLPNWKHMRYLLDHNLSGFSPSQERPLRTRLTRPWHVVGTDLFTWNGDEYLLTFDFNSKFPIMKKIPSGQPFGQTAYKLRHVRTRCTRSRTVKATDSSLKNGAFST